MGEILKGLFDWYFELKENGSEIFKLIPELEICRGFEQNNNWHIYDVYEHILHVVKFVDNNICLRIAALFHDVGKPFCYSIDQNGVGHFYNHWNKSAKILQKYFEKLNLSKDQEKLISNLVFYHDINIDKLNKIELNKIISDIGYNNIGLLFSLKRADLLAQSPEYHILLSNLDRQEELLKKTKIL